MRALFVIALSFTAGFLIHALFFPDVLYRGLAQRPSVQGVETKSKSTVDQSLTTVIFENDHFGKRNVVVKRGYYFEIVNGGETPMFLVSDNPAFVTPRGYGKSEGVRMRLDEKKGFTVFLKQNSNEFVKVTVE